MVDPLTIHAVSVPAPRSLFFMTFWCSARYREVSLSSMLVLWAFRTAGPGLSEH